MTGFTAVSLGARRYESLLSNAGLFLEASYLDEGENHYYACIKR